jgi:ADP-heptose:LPS heptosyltransferase
MLSPASSLPVIRIGIYRTSSLGDVVLATACLDLLSSLPIATEVIWIGRGASLDMVSKSWPKIKVIEMSRSDSSQSLSKALSELKNCHIFIDLQGNLRSQLLGRRLRTLYGIRYVGMPKSQIARSRLILEARMRGRRRPLPASTARAWRLQYQTMVDTLKQALREHLPSERWDGLEQENYRPRLPIPEDFDPPWRKELRIGMWLGIAPGAAHSTKEAPLEIFAETILETRQNILKNWDSKTVQSYPLGLVFFGDQKDREKAHLLLDRLQWTGPVLNLAGRLSLWESAVALSETTALLSNDSSLSHIAEAVDTPNAVLFGPTVEAFGFAPRMTQSRAFSTLTGCRPCSKHGKLACRYGDKLCFNSLDVSMIAVHIVRLLTISHGLFLKKLTTRQSAQSSVVESSADTH